MRIVIAYFSKFGNGKKAVNYLKDLLIQKGEIVQVLSIMDMKPKDLPPADFYIFSAPTQVGGVAGKMKRFLKKMSIPEGAKCGVLMTHASGKPALHKMEKILTSKGAVKVVEADIKVLNMKGPLEEGYEQKLEEFAKKMG